MHTVLSYFAGGEVVERKLNGRIGQILVAYQYCSRDFIYSKNIFAPFDFVNKFILKNLKDINFFNKVNFLDEPPKSNSDGPESLLIS